MTTHLENLARRLESDPFFLACPLKVYAKSERLDEEAMAAQLKCSDEALLPLRLCRTPAPDSASFHQEIERIAARFSVDADALAEAVRRGQALFEMTRGGRASGTLLAARDGDVKTAPVPQEGIDS